MKHLGAIAGRELRSLFVSPVAYAVLTLFAVLAGFFFLLSVQGFRETMAYYQQIGQFESFLSLSSRYFMASASNKRFELPNLLAKWNRRLS